MCHATWIQGAEEIGPSIEEQLNPHTYLDEAPGRYDDRPPDVLNNGKLKKIDRQIKLTVLNVKRFGWSDKCPRCLDLKAGHFRIDKHHTDECNLRMRVHFREADAQKWVFLDVTNTQAERRIWRLYD